MGQTAPSTNHDRGASAPLCHFLPFRVPRTFLPVRFLGPWPLTPFLSTAVPWGSELWQVYLSMPLIPHPHGRSVSGPASPALRLAMPPILSSLSPNAPNPLNYCSTGTCHLVQNWTRSKSASPLHSILFPFSPAQPHPCVPHPHIPHLSSWLHHAPRGHVRPCIYSLIFLLRVVGAGWPTNEIHPLQECQWITGLLAFRHSSPPANLQGGKGAFGQRGLCDFQGPNQQRARGCFPAQLHSSGDCGSQQLREDMEKAVCPLASVSHGKTTWRHWAPGHKCMQGVRGTHHFFLAPPPLDLQT